MLLSCRFYKEKYPEVDDVVMVTVKVKPSAEMGAYVHLTEYDYIEGMIPRSELSKRPMRWINKLISAGQTEPVKVIRVDKEKGYIELSERQVSPEDVEKCIERFAKAKAVNLILSHVAELLAYDSDEMLENLYQKTAWRYEEKNKKASAYDIFKQANIDPSILAECGLDNHTEEILLKHIKRKLTSQAVKIRADIEVACYGYEGIDAVKAALKAGLATSTEELPIKINLIAPPLYVVTTDTSEKLEGLKALRNAIDVIEKEITNLGGTFKIETAPKVVTAKVEDLMIRLDSLDQDRRRKMIEICGVPFARGENLREIVTNTSLALGVRLESSDIEVIHRIRQRGSPIVVRLRDISKKDALIEQRQLKNKNFALSNIGFHGGLNSAVFVNESLTGRNRYLLFLARDLKREGVIDSVSVSRGRIMIGKAGGQKASIRSEKDIEAWRK